MVQEHRSESSSLLRRVICLENLRALIFTNEARCAVALMIGLALGWMSYKAGRRITHRAGGGIAAGLGGLLYIYRSLRRLREGGQLEIETYRDYLKEKTYIVTGGARGIGWASVLLLCEGGAKRVVLAIRNSEKRKNELLSEYENWRRDYKLSQLSVPINGEIFQKTELEFVEFDASSRESALACAKKLKEIHSHYDGILCNAGIYNVPDAMEINWLNQAILLDNLLTHVDRIVTVSSVMHSIGCLKGTLEETKNQQPMVVYGTGKLGMLFEARFLAEKNIQAVSAHPGYVVTGMTSSFGLLGFPGCLGKSKKSGAMTPVGCLIMKDVTPGAYYDTIREAPIFRSAKSKEQYQNFLAIRQQYFTQGNTSA